MVSKKKLQNYIKSLNPKIFGAKKIRKIKIKSLPKGNWNYNYVVQINQKKFVFKIYSPSKKEFFENSGKKEYTALKLFSKSNFVPNPVYFDESKKFFNKEVLIYEYAEGKTLKKFENTDVIKLARIFSLIHTSNYDKLSGILEKKQENPKILLSQLFKSLEDYKKRKEKIDEYAQKFEYYLRIASKQKTQKTNHPLSIIHTDPVPSNIITNSENIYLIDWQSPKIGDPAFDVWAATNKAYHLWDIPQTMTAEQKNIFLQEYIKKTGDSEVVQRIKTKEPLWLLETGIYCLNRHTDFKQGKINVSKKRNQNFERYKKAMDITLELLDKKLNKKIKSPSFPAAFWLGVMVLFFLLLFLCASILWLFVPARISFSPPFPNVIQSF